MTDQYTRPLQGIQQKSVYTLIMKYPVELTIETLDGMNQENQKQVILHPNKQECVVDDLKKARPIIV